MERNEENDSPHQALLLPDENVAYSDFSENDVPPDSYRLVYIIFFIQGVGMLLPWNFFITAKEYFDYKFQNDPSVQSKFENAFSLGAMFPTMISLFFNIFLTNKLSRSCRIVTCLFIMFSMFVMTAVFVNINTESWTDTFFALTIVSVVLMNISSGVYQGTLFGVAGIVGQSYTQAIMGGQGMAGIFAATADLISKLANPNSDPLSSAFGYFLTASVVIMLTAFSYLMLFKLPRMKYYFLRFQNQSKNMSESVQDEKKNASVSYISIFRQIMPLALSVACVFCVTLSLFPSVISKIESVHKANKSRVTNELFSNLVCFLIFNVGDWGGRTVAGIFQIFSKNSKWIPILCLSRVVFIPLYLMCNFNNNSSGLPYVFKADYWPIIFTCLFSLSNGYLGSLCMMYAPQLVALKHSEIAGTIMSLFLTTGLTAGACLSFAYNV